MTHAKRDAVIAELSALRRRIDALDAGLDEDAALGEDVRVQRAALESVKADFDRWRLRLGMPAVYAARESRALHN